MEIYQSAVKWCLTFALGLCMFVINVTQSLVIPSIKVFGAGPAVFQTGYLEYTVVNGEGSCFISCKSVTYASSHMILFKDGKILKETLKANGDISLIYFSSQQCKDSIFEGNYSIYQNISYQLPNGANYSYTVSRSFKIRQANFVFCETTIGDTGILQESANLICIGNGNSWRTTGQTDLSTNSNTFRMTVGDRRSQLSCGKGAPYGGWNETCKVTGIEVQSLRIEILPKQFTNVSKLLQLQCRSYPPRMMYWEVYSSDGNILDPATHNQSIRSNIDIDIYQSIGHTSIDINGNFAGSHGIQIVVCFTYDTQIATASAHLITQTFASGYQNDWSTATIYAGETTDTIDKQERTLLYSNRPFIVVITASSFIIAILLLWKLFDLLKARKISSKAGDENKTVIPSETDLHYNTVYQSADHVDVALTEDENEYCMIPGQVNT